MSAMERMSFSIVCHFTEKFLVEQFRVKQKNGSDYPNKYCKALSHNLLEIRRQNFYFFNYVRL